MKLNVEADKKMIIRIPATLHRKIKILSAETMKSMNLIIIETLRNNIK